MSKEFYQTVAAKAGFAGEYEALTEPEIAGATQGGYSIGDEGVFKIVSSRIVQLLLDSPVYIETFQTSAATLRVPSGAIGTNDAEDGRFYFLRNAGTGNITLQKSNGTLIDTLPTGKLFLIIHGDNDTWDTHILNSTGTNTPYHMVLGGKYSNVQLPLTGIGIEIAHTDTILKTFIGRRGVVGNSGTTTIQLEIDGAAIPGATLSWTTSDAAFALKSVPIDQTITAGARISFRLTSAETNGRDIYTVVS